MATAFGMLAGVLYMTLLAMFLGVAGLTPTYTDASTRATTEVAAQGMVMARPLGALVYFFFAIGAPCSPWQASTLTPFPGGWASRA